MNDTQAANAGFTLLEIVCTLAILAMTAAILLPAVPYATSRSRIEAYAVETAALLKQDRIAAIRNRGQIDTRVDPDRREIISGSANRMVRIPSDVDFESILPRRCNRHPVLSAISFMQTGMSCGGVITLTRSGVGFEIRVNWLTGNVEVVPHPLAKI